MKIKEMLLAFAAWWLGLIVSCREMIFSGFSRMQVDAGDTRFNNYVLEHGYLWVKNVLGIAASPSHSRFWDMPIFYPLANVTAYSDTLLGTAPIYWFFRAFLGPEISFQLWVIAQVSLNFWVFLWFLRANFSFKFFPALIGAFFFAFCGARIAFLNHAQLLAEFYLVLAVWAVMRRRIGWFYLSFVLEFYSSFYLGWFLFLGLLFALIWARKSFFERKLSWISGGIVSLLVLSPMIVHYAEAARFLGARPYAEVSLMLPRPQSWFYFGDASWLYGWLSGFWPWRGIHSQGLGHEHQIGVGFVTLLLAFVGLAKRGKVPRFFPFAAILLMICVTRWVGPLSLWRILFHLLPAAKGIRAVSRIVLLLLIPLAIGLAAFFDELKFSRKWIGTLLLLVVILEQGRSLPSFDWREGRKGVDSISARIDPRACAAFYYSPEKIPESDYLRDLSQIDAMWAGIESGVPSVNGYSGSFPQAFLDDGLFRFDKVQLDRWAAENGLDEKAICWVKI